MLHSFIIINLLNTFHTWWLFVLYILFFVLKYSQFTKLIINILNENYYQKCNKMLKFEVKLKKNLFALLRYL